MYDLSNFRVIYEDRVLNAIAIEGIMYPEAEEGGDEYRQIVRPLSLSILALETDGTLVEICDKAWKFQFLPKVRE